MLDSVGNVKGSINSCPRNILISVVGVLILLLGMGITSIFTEGVINSVVNIVVLYVAILFVIKSTRIENLLDCEVVFFTLAFVTVFVLFNIWLGDTVIYKDYLYGHSSDLSGHYEHSLMFSEMSTIATRLKSGMTLNEATSGLPLNQYYNIFVYSSMMFLAGGINATNMCIWNAFHMLLCPIFMILILDKYGIEKSRHLRSAYYISLLQPLFLSFSMYNKVIIGEALVIMALYIFISTYNNPQTNLICLPIYGYLFWTVRLQYIFVAGFLFVLCLVHNRTSKRVTIPAFAAIFVIALFSLRGFSHLYYDLNVGHYHEGHDLSLASFPARLVRSALPYFPLSNIFNDQYWYFNMFCVPQEIMNLTLWGLVYASHGKLNLAYARKTLRNPLVVAAILLLLGGTLSEMHTTYVSVGTVLLTSSLGNVSMRKFAAVFAMVFMAAVLLTCVYNVLGLAGTGIAGVDFS